MTPPPCVIYGCDDPADEDGTVTFALPGGGTLDAHVCRRHRGLAACEPLLDLSTGNAVNAEPGDTIRVTLDQGSWT